MLDELKQELSKLKSCATSDTRSRCIIRQSNIQREPNASRAAWRDRRPGWSGGCFGDGFKPIRGSPNFWRDPKSGVSYQVQVQVPQARMTSMKDIETIPVASATGAHPLVTEMASVRAGSVPGELDRQNGLWMIGLSG